MTKKLNLPRPIFLIGRPLSRKKNDEFSVFPSEYLLLFVCFVVAPFTLFRRLLSFAPSLPTLFFWLSLFVSVCGSAPLCGDDDHRALEKIAIRESENDDDDDVLDASMSDER
uniref:(northern house mosquito) hypothetical protein n=1 Tax=Culex pipiens TaxID=7175 RepID=A0A8D8MTH0_CULPI